MPDPTDRPLPAVEIEGSECLPFLVPRAGLMLVNCRQPMTLSDLCAVVRALDDEAQNAVFEAFMAERGYVLMSARWRKQLAGRTARLESELADERRKLAALQVMYDMCEDHRRDAVMRLEVCAEQHGAERAKVERLEAALSGDPADDIARCRIERGDEKWHDGPGWYYIDCDYPEDGSCGAYETLAKCVLAACGADYFIESIDGERHEEPPDSTLGAK